MSIDDWNREVRPKECEGMAEEGDIVEYIDGVLFLCQRKNDYNNIVAFSKEKELTLKHIRAMFGFCVILYEKYGIQFVRVEGNNKRYRFLERMFPREVVVKDEEITDRNVYYINLSKANSKFREQYEK